MEIIVDSSGSLNKITYRGDWTGWMQLIKPEQMIGQYVRSDHAQAVQHMYEDFRKRLLNLNHLLNKANKLERDNLSIIIDKVKNKDLWIGADGFDLTKAYYFDDPETKQNIRLNMYAFHAYAVTKTQTYPYKLTKLDIGLRDNNAGDRIGYEYDPVKWAANIMDIFRYRLTKGAYIY